MFFILCRYNRTYILIHIFKNCRQHSYGFQNLMSSLGWGNAIFEITIFTWVSTIWFQKAQFFWWKSVTNEICERFFENDKNLICYSKLRKTKSCFGARKTLNFRVSTYSVPWGPGQMYTRGTKGRVYGWEGMGRMRWDGWMKWNSYSFLQFSSYFVV